MVNTSIFVQGIGAVSPAGWGMDAFRDALKKNTSLPTKELSRPASDRKLHVRQVPAPPTRPSFLAHPRLRRTSPITQYAIAAALEALGQDSEKITQGELRLGIVFCVMSGCVNYSRRFYDEALRDPSTASPLVFPETVFNAPSSHLAALLKTNAINYTIVGDPGTFLEGIALAADWLTSGKVDGCLVIGAEEVDWITSDAYRRFQRKVILSDGAGALYLKTKSDSVEAAQLTAVTSAHPFLKSQSRHCAAAKMRAELPGSAAGTLLSDGIQNLPVLDSAEKNAWRDWNGERVSVKTILGEGLMAAAAWQCVAAVDAVRTKRSSAANVSVVGCNQQAIGAQFVMSNSISSF
ncbi:MAG: Beta-ketoacyl synthase [Verrucomicrobiales bacterium]|nr:Beta-ketoacyl synthase [Verrucomicrobiales bacterium]